MKTVSPPYPYGFRFLKFTMVGMSGVLVNLAVLYLLTELAGIFYLASAVTAVIISATNNYAWNYLWTFSDKNTNMISGWAKYLGMSVIASVAYLVILVTLVELLCLWYVVSASISIALTFLFRYFVASRYIWKN